MARILKTIFHTPTSKFEGYYYIWNKKLIIPHFEESNHVRFFTTIDDAKFYLRTIVQTSQRRLDITLLIPNHSKTKLSNKLLKIIEKLLKQIIKFMEIEQSNE